MFKKRFPTSGPRARLVRPDSRLPERELVKMKSRYLIKQALAGIASERNTGQADTFDCAMITNMIPTTVWGLVPSPIVAPTGFTAMSLLYSNWQVRGVRCTVNIKLISRAGGFPTIPIYIVLLPVSTTIGTITAATPFNQLLLMKDAKYSKVAPTNLYDAGPGAFSGQTTLTCFTSPSKVQSTPGYYSNNSTWGTGTTVPTSLPKWHIGIGYETTFGANVLDIEFETIFTYSVMWFNKKLSPLQLENLEPSGEVVESKEEKKSGEDEDGDEEEFDRLPMFTERLKVEEKEEKAPPALPLVRCDATAGSAVLATCLAPSHPRTPHLKVSTCV